MTIFLGHRNVKGWYIDYHQKHSEIIQFLTMEVADKPLNTADNRTTDKLLNVLQNTQRRKIDIKLSNTLR